jgi:hypothetical protein
MLNYDTWYRENRDKVLARRREQKRRRKETGEAPGLKLGPDGKLHECFRISEVAKRIGRTPLTIRLWEQKGIIPKPIFPGPQRFYTKAQITLLKKLVYIYSIYDHEMHTKRAKARLRQWITSMRLHWEDYDYGRPTKSDNQNSSGEGDNHD